ncbi:MAG: Flp pilus assembly complex ATPase component TadA [Candidatus Thorarchaeota archaeon]|nr:Flp pilus assembly complex ATPase component TadA [Candidatus Thorarchaeota archaeon]
MTTITEATASFKKQSSSIILCHKHRCSHCEFLRSDDSCEQIAKINKEREQAILVEQSRGLVHIQQNGFTNRPPWKVDSTQKHESSSDHIQIGNEQWETIYLGDGYGQMLNHLILVYPVGPYISLFAKGNTGNVIYRSAPRIRTPLELEIIDKLHTSTLQTSQKIIRLDYLLSQWRQSILTRINNELPEIKKETKARIASIVAYSHSVLGPIFPLMLDELIEDIYLDRPGSRIYFDHRFLGRCTSSIVIRQEDANRIVTLLRAESNFHLDRRNPSIKTELFLENSRLRFSVTIPPLSYDGFHLEIRRARTSPFTIFELVNNGTLSTKAASLLLLALIARMNITIAGEPGSGKTTLLNALDYCTPRSWRKIYVEDAIESRIQNEHHQIRYRVSPVDEMAARFSKIDEITKSLHRSPDYLILGEIQTAEHSKALFQALMSGLRSIQTCHSSSASALVSRWRFAHSIKEHAIALMDLIVILERPQPGRSKRIVKEIVEIRRDVEQGILKFKGLNTLYTHDADAIRSLADDGAISRRSREYGVNDPRECIRELSTILARDLTPSMETHWKIGELLWENGNPFSFT